MGDKVIHRGDVADGIPGGLIVRLDPGELRQSLARVNCPAGDSADGVGRAIFNPLFDDRLRPGVHPRCQVISNRARSINGCDRTTLDRGGQASDFNPGR